MHVPVCTDSRHVASRKSLYCGRGEARDSRGCQSVNLLRRSCLPGEEPYRMCWSALSTLAERQALPSSRTSIILFPPSSRLPYVNSQHPHQNVYSAQNPSSLHHCEHSVYHHRILPNRLDRIDSQSYILHRHRVHISRCPTYRVMSSTRRR